MSDPTAKDFPASIGVLGVGLMGGPMTHHLLTKSPAGVAVTVFGRSAARLQPYLDAGARFADSPADLARRSEIILMMLPDLPQLEAYLDGDSGLLAGIDRPTTLIISSTSSAAGVRALSARLLAETNGLVHVVDAPVSGGPEGAAAGTLSIMVGGTEQDVAQVRPVLELFGTPTHLGPLGSGEVAKACNQLIVGSTMVALAEAAVLAERAGLDLARLFEVFAGGYAASRMLTSRGDRLVTKDYSTLSAAAFLRKDLGFAADLADDTQTSTMVLQAVLQSFEQVIQQGLGELDIAVVQGLIADQKPGPPTATHS